MEKQGEWLFKYRGQLPVLLLVFGLLTFYFQMRNDALFPVNQQLWMFVCLGVSLIGLAIRGYTIGQVPKDTSGRNTGKQIANTLNTTGIYSIVRNPLYLGNFVMYLGIALYVQSIPFLLVFILLFFIYYERIIFTEEAFLRKSFGQSYLDWAAKTPVFFPKFSLWTKNKLRFSLKNVLKREYSGFFSLFLVFFCLIGNDNGYNMALLN